MSNGTRLVPAGALLVGLGPASRRAPSRPRSASTAASSALRSRSRRTR
jgi:hypothetical protein